MEVKEVKYKAIKITTQAPEKFLSCFLADTQEEAEQTHEEFSKCLNSIAYSYHLSTGLDKAELFSEGLVGLARAKRDYDPTRSLNFKTYAIFRIKDALNKYIRENMAPVKIPAYIRKAHSLITKLKQELGNELFEQALRNNNREVLGELGSAADRCNLSVIELANRATVLPTELEFLDTEHSSNTDDVFNKILVDELKRQMTAKELIVAKGISEGKSYEQIGKENNKSKSWVASKIQNLRNRFEHLS